jgi:hypothetical protein
LEGTFFHSIWQIMMSWNGCLFNIYIALILPNCANLGKM